MGDVVDDVGPSVIVGAWREAVAGWLEVGGLWSPWDAGGGPRPVSEKVGVDAEFRLGAVEERLGD